MPVYTFTIKGRNRYGSHSDLFYQAYGKVGILFIGNGIISNRLEV
jgi:hypothetical protein